jgi:riboflavin synthase
VSRRPGVRLSIVLPGEFHAFLVPKGSVAVNGVSLTVAAVNPSSFEVELIPATLGATNLGRLRPGAEVNIECDLIGKYVYNFLNRPGR